MAEQGLFEMGCWRWVEEVIQYVGQDSAAAVACLFSSCPAWIHLQQASGVLLHISAAIPGYYRIVLLSSDHLF